MDWMKKSWRKRLKQIDWKMTNLKKGWNWKGWKMMG